VLFACAASAGIHAGLVTSRVAALALGGLMFAYILTRTTGLPVLDPGPETVDELKGNYTADALAFGPYIQHILDMADMISSGIIREFPGRFTQR
jgi:hypothetical protein